MKTHLTLPTRGDLRKVDVELVDVRRDNHLLEEWKSGYGPATKESVYFTMLVESVSEIRGPGWEYRVRPGEGLLVLPGESIQARFWGEKVLRSYNIHFKVSGMSESAILEIFPRFVGLADDSARLQDSLDCLIDAKLRQDAVLEQSEFCSFLLELSRVPLRRSRRNLTPCVRSALDYLRRHASRHPSRQEVADFVGVSPGHLSRSVSLETGHPLSWHSRQVRVRLAKDLMYSESLNISETADRLGIDVCAFSKLFKSVTGKSPAHYLRETVTGAVRFTHIDDEVVLKECRTTLTMP